MATIFPAQPHPHTYCRSQLRPVAPPCPAVSCPVLHCTAVSYHAPDLLPSAHLALLCLSVLALLYMKPILPLPLLD